MTAWAYRGALLGLVVAVTARYRWLLVPGVFAMVAFLGHRRAPIRQAQRQARADVVVAGRTMLLALAGGMPLPAALSMAAHEVGRVVAAELEQVLRVARRNGTAAALAASAGTHTRPLLSRLARAQASGAPMTDAVASFLTEIQAARKAEALERVRRLPVTLMIPLGLLILPGFVVLFVGPIAIGSIVDLLGQVP